MIPPQLTSLTGYATRLGLIGLGFGIAAAVVLGPRGVPMIAFALAWWILAFLIAGAIAPLRAKPHRAGPGYPAEPEQWLRTFAVTLTVSVAAVGALGTIMVSAAPVMQGAWTAALILAVLTAVAAIAAWLLGTRMPLFLLYGTRE